jgi:putative transposase
MALLKDSRKLSIYEDMKLVSAIKLKPSREQAQALRETLERCNAACTKLAAKGYETGTFRQFALHKMGYRDLRSEFGLTAQAAIRSIAKVADAFKINRATAPVFRKLAAQPYDDRILRFGDDFVSIWTLDGRIKIPFVAGEHQRALLAFRKGESDLCFYKGKWILAVVCDIPETEEFNPSDWLGVDLGVINIAADSDGNIHSGADIERVRSRLAKRKARLQRCGTKAAKRRLKKLAGKEARFRKHVNHNISKELVSLAERTGRGIALEELTHIRSRVTARRKQRARLHSWSFAQFRAFMSYKAKRRGVPVAFVDPRNTSKGCSACGVIDARNRPDQATFSCVSCGHTDHADLNAARNIRFRARATVTMPDDFQAGMT